MSSENRVVQRRIEPAEAGRRIDLFISETLGLFSRSQVKGRVVQVLVNGAEARLSRKLKPGDLLDIRYTDPPELRLHPEPLELDILFENADVIVLNKPQGLVVHPGAGHPSGTLVHGLLHHVKNLGERFEGEPLRPGIVHRLDKDTSGVLIAAKNRQAQEFLAGQFRENRVKKQYLAVVRGVPPQPEGRIENRLIRDPRHRQRFTWLPPASFSGPARGRRALTRYRVIRSFGDSALVSLRPRTGRTHQLRVHMLSLGCPILGDPLYGKKDRSDWPLMLHAYRLAITLPGEEQRREFRAPVPERFLRYLRGRKGST